MTGCLGDIVFTVSSNKVMTPNKLRWSGSARHTEHRRHLANALSEFTGVDPDKMAFEITLLEELGVDVMAELVKIWSYERSGEALTLVLGEKAYGKYRWTIRSHNITMRNFDKDGNLTGAVVALNLADYLSE